MGGGSQPAQKTDRSELNELFNQSPETQFMGNSSQAPTPTPSPVAEQASAMTFDVLKRLGVLS